MDVKITNVYSNVGQPEKNLKGAYGNGFYLEFGSEKILFDVGWKGKVLQHNLNELNINVDEIGNIISDYFNGFLINAEGGFACVECCE